MNPTFWRAEGTSAQNQVNPIGGMKMDTNQPVRQTEMGKAVGSLFSAIDVLTDRLKLLRERVSCVSMAKPKNTKKDSPQTSCLPTLIQEIRTAENKIQVAYEFVNEMLEDLEV